MKQKCTFCYARNKRLSWVYILTDLGTKFGGEREEKSFIDKNEEATNNSWNSVKTHKNVTVLQAPKNKRTYLFCVQNDSLFAEHD